MNSGGRTKLENPNGVSFKTLGLVLGSAAAGGVISLFFLRASSDGVESISFTGLIGFSFMLILSTVAITLSVVSISLSRKVERMLLNGGELAQPQVAVCRKESAILPVAIGNTELVGGKSAQMEPCVDVVEKAEKKYSDFKDIVLLGVSNYPGVSARKIGEGHYCSEGDELVDGSFLINRDQVAVCVFSIGDVLAARFLGKQGEKFSGVLQSLFNELKNGNFSRVFLVFDGVLDRASLYAKALNDFSDRIEASVFSRFELFEGSPELVIPELTERVSQLMAQGAGEIGD